MEKYEVIMCLYKVLITPFYLRKVLAMGNFLIFTLLPQFLKASYDVITAQKIMNYKNVGYSIPH